MSEAEEAFVRISERVQRDEGLLPMDSAPHDGSVIIVRFMWGYVSAKWSPERNYWVSAWRGGEIPGAVYGWVPTEAAN